MLTPSSDALTAALVLRDRRISERAAAAALLSQKLSAAEVTEADEKKAIAMELTSSIEEAVSAATRTFECRARNAAAQRHVAEARAALDVAKAAESAAIKNAQDLALQEIGPEIRSAINQCVELYIEWQSSVAEVLGLAMLNLLPQLTLEQWRAASAIATPNAAGAGIQLPGPPMVIGENWADHRPLRAAAFEARNSWARRLAALAEQPAPAPVADAMLVGPVLTAAALQAVDRRDPVQFAP